jgi:hypothetical protein
MASATQATVVNMLNGSLTNEQHMTKHRLNTREAAEALGISIDAVRMRARRGALASEHEHGRVYVWVDDDQIGTKHKRTLVTDDGEITPFVQKSPAWNHLTDQLSWYDAKSVQHQLSFKRARMVEIVLAAFIPVLALTGATWSSLGAAVLGAIISIMAAYRQLTQSDALGVEYRNIANQLRRERFLFLARAGPHADFEAPDEALRFLAERVDTIISESTIQSEHPTQSQDQQGPPQIVTVPRSM